MNFPAKHRWSVPALCLGGLLLILAPGCGHKPAPPPPAAAKPKVDASKTNSVAAAAAATNEFESVFEDTLLPPKGKDPFFPDSQRRHPVSTVVAAPVHVAPVLVLKAIISAGKDSQAMVNNAMLQVGGEPQVVHIHPSGQVKVSCLEIGENYVVVQVEGEAQPKRLVIEQRKGLQIK